MKLVSVYLLVLLTKLTSQISLEEVISKIHHETLLIIGGRFGTTLPQVIGNGSQALKLHSKFNGPVLAVIFLEDLMQINTLKAYLDDIVSSKIIIVLKKVYLEILDVFEKCWSHGFLNVVVMTQQGIFEYSPFENAPSITIEKISDPFGGPIRSYHGYSVSFGGELLGIASDSFMGFIVECAQYFERQFNISFSVSPSPDIFMTTVANFRFDDDEPRESLNDFHFESYQVIVPKNTFSNKSLYFVLPFNLDVWITIITYIILGAVMLNVMERLVTMNSDFTRNLLDCFSMTLCIAICFRSKHSVSNFIYLAMIVMGIVLVNLYSLYLGSFLIADISSRDFKVALVLQTPMFQSGVHNGINIQYVPMDSSLYSSHLYGFDTNYGYVISSYLWRDERFKDDFRLLDNDKDWYSFPLACMIKKNSIFKEIFNDFGTKGHSSALFAKWFEDAIKPKSEGKESKMEKDDMLGLPDLMLPFCFYLFGMVSSCLIFLVEVLWVNKKRNGFKKIKKSKKIVRKVAQKILLN